jgi:hypothetical protein
MASRVSRVKDYGDMELLLEGETLTARLCSHAVVRSGIASVMGGMFSGLIGLTGFLLFVVTLLPYKGPPADLFEQRLLFLGVSIAGFTGVVIAFLSRRKAAKARHEPFIFNRRLGFLRRGDRVIRRLHEINGITLKQYRDQDGDFFGVSLSFTDGTDSEICHTFHAYDEAHFFARRIAEFIGVDIQEE